MNWLNVNINLFPNKYIFSNFRIYNKKNSSRNKILKYQNRKRIIVDNFELINNKWNSKLVNDINNYSDSKELLSDCQRDDNHNFYYLKLPV